ncbi:hypothetical protein FACS189472_15300 [Alphaproteobacteria bacterium]|nr:hypothetical protein FACS189472_15300 [Alphaproteobacteria bacterium]
MEERAEEEEEEEDEADDADADDVWVCVGVGVRREAAEEAIERMEDGLRGGVLSDTGGDTPFSSAYFFTGDVERDTLVTNPAPTPAIPRGETAEADPDAAAAAAATAEAGSVEEE